MNKYLEKIAEFNEVPTGEYVAGGIIGGSLGAIGGLVSAERKNKPINAAIEETKFKLKGNSDMLDLWNIRERRRSHPRIDAIVEKAIKNNSAKFNAMDEARKIRGMRGRMVGEISHNLSDFPVGEGKFEKYMSLPRNHVLTPEDIEFFHGDKIRALEEKGKGAINKVQFLEDLEKRVNPLKERKSALRKNLLNKQITKLEATKVGSGKRALIGAGIGALGGMGAAWMAHQGE